MSRRVKAFICRTLAATVFLAAAGLSAADLQAQVDLLSGSGQAGRELAEVSAVLAVSSAAAGRTYAAAAVVDIAEEWHVNSAEPYQDFLIPAVLAFDTMPGITPHGVAYPAGSEAVLGGERMSVYDGRVVVRFEVSIDQDAPPGEVVLPVRFTYQPCNDRECRAPETAEVKLPIEIGEEGQPINADIFAAASSPGAEEPSAVPAAESDLERLIDNYGFWGYFLALGIAFITGLLLSFSPCTYPMIPITVSVFAGQQRSVGKGFVLSLFYVGSMAVMYGIMGLIVSLVGGVFGAWLASPPVVVGIAVVFVVFALSMFGLYELNVPLSVRQKLGSAKKSGGVLGAIVLGIVAAMVVSPCVGPFVAGILLYVATHGSPVVGFLVLFVFALGLGTLFVIIGTFSSAINALPNSGVWMETVKKFFGFVLLLMALYFLSSIITVTLTAILTGLLLLALGVFGGGLDRLTPESGFFLRLKKFVGTLAMLVGIYLLGGMLITQGLILPPGFGWFAGGSQTIAAGEPELIGWEKDLETGLARAEREGKPVLIDTWATWCVNCRILDKKTFRNAGVAAEAERFVPIKVQLEKAGSPTTKQFMARFGMKHYSLPTTLLLDSAGRVRRVMQGVVGPDDMLDEMRRIH